MRDEDVVSQLVPAAEPAEGDELFGVFGFHFDAGEDNSGLVGWLACHLKAELGTGVLVICGSTRARGGIYDHWGVPWALHDRALEVIGALRSSSGP